MELEILQEVELYFCRKLFQLYLIKKIQEKFKEIITTSKVSGQDNGANFNREVESEIDLFKNSIDIFNNQVSPISTYAFTFYNYKLEGAFDEKNGKLINKIKLIEKGKK